MNPYSRAPHSGPDPNHAAQNAALLIDFDNVTMGMRSDLAKELKKLLESDIIKGKVTVQRAYADWRRYPQYIVPLSEASIDLIFAPAYGSSKKNATDIRMAIDGMELVFIRPEIGTFILLTGDSDFSSLVLKLKEYGKYVIGIGIQESSSDILVQNCDEYYSYTSVTGLSKTSEGGRPQDGLDPWQCASDAVARMASRGDVMRSDRLKQVMMELSPGFDERNLGFKKFSKFVTEAANKGLLRIARRENGQYEVAPPGDPGGERRARGGDRGGERPARGGGRSGERTGRGGDGGKVAAQATAVGKPAGDGGPNGGEPRGRGRKGSTGGKAAPAGEPKDGKDREGALKLLARAMREFGEKARQGVRDSDLKRKLLILDRDFDEGRLGFGKFSKFLQFAEAKGVVSVARQDGGGFRVRIAVAVDFDVKALGLPTTVDAIKSYLTNRYKGIGVKTADRLVTSFETELFTVMRDEPQKVHALLPKARAARVLAAWEEDYKRRTKQHRDRGTGPVADAAGAGGRAGSASPKSGATVHEPRARNFGRGRVGAKVGGRRVRGGRPDAEATGPSAGTAADARRTAAESAGAAKDDMAAAATEMAGAATRAASAATATAGAATQAAGATTQAAGAEAEEPPPRKKAAKVLGGLFSRRGRGRSGGGD